MDILSQDPLSSAARWGALAAALAFTAASPLSFSPPSISPERASVMRAELDEDMAGKHWGEALFNTQRLLKAFPEDSVYLNLEAEIYEHLGDTRSQAAALELSIAISPTPTESCPALGRAYSKLGLKEKALDADRRCLALEPTNCDLRLFYALSLERNDKYEEARRGFESVLAVAPDYADAKQGLARLRSHFGGDNK